ncbi:MAG: hypothetical protein OXS35_08585, partial [Dehalococcoidia bacterium]|nr:hypothetical protein [Dehalococcoidia bacterium]
VEGRGATRIAATQILQQTSEPEITSRSPILSRELIQGMHERLRHILAAKSSKASSLIRLYVGCLHL